MSDSSEEKLWLRYARENLQTAKLAVDAGLLNPALQNAQQAVEKALKAIGIQSALPLLRTHSIRDLNRGIRSIGIDVGLSDSDCELLDSIYAGSKYPPESSVPDNMPDRRVCLQCIQIAESVLAVAVGRID